MTVTGRDVAGAVFPPAEATATTARVNGRPRACPTTHRFGCTTKPRWSSGLRDAGYAVARVHALAADIRR